MERFYYEIVSSTEENIVNHQTSPIIILGDLDSMVIHATVLFLLPAFWYK